jgi:hypothetical protein
LSSPVVEPVETTNAKKAFADDAEFVPGFSM